MKKIFIIFLIGLIPLRGLVAQDSNKKEWSDGKLTWNDFSERTDIQPVSELRYFLGYNSKRQKFGDTLIVRIIAYGYIDKKLSLVNPESKTEQLLRYNQVIFDIVECYKRKLQLKLDKMRILEAESIFQQVYSHCTNEIYQFQKESKNGQNLDVIILWEQDISKKIFQYSERPIPEFKTSDFGYALHAGFGFGSFTGTVGKYFSPTFNFMFGFDFAYKKSIFYLNATLGGGHVKKDYTTSAEIWHKKKNTVLAIGDISYGYAFIDNQKLKLTPFLGFGFNELTLSVPKTDDKEKGYRLNDFNVIFGINTDYKFRKTLNFVGEPLFGAKEKVEFSIRSRLYITKANYAPDMKGYSINLSIGVCGFGNFIRL